MSHRMVCPQCGFHLTTRKKPPTSVRADHRKHESLDLWLSWWYPNGNKIWQGRPFEDRRFVYRVIRPDGSFEDFKKLNEARSAATRE